MESGKRPKKSVVWVKVLREKCGGWRKERLLPAEGIRGCFEEAADGGRGRENLEGR